MPELAPRLRSVTERPGVWLAGCAVLTLVLGLGLLRLELRTDGAALYPTGEPVVERTAADRRAFHERDRVLVLLTSWPGGAAVDSPRGLRLVKRLHEELADLPRALVGRVRSLATLPDLQPDTPLLLTPDFLDVVPDDRRAFAALRERIRAWPLAQGLFLAPGGRAAAFYVSVARGADRERLVAELERWAEEHRDADFELRLTGPVTAEVTLGTKVLRDLAWLVPGMVAGMAVLLFVCLRSAAGVLVPMAELLMVLVWTLGAMGHLGVPVTLVTTVLPVLLMTVAVADEIHLLEHFRRHVRQLLQEDGEGETVAADRSLRRRALESALSEIARPIVLTSLTTAAGFLSFLSASMAPVRHFGLFTAFGVLAAMALTFTFVPALVMALPAGWFRERSARPAATLPLPERWAVRHRRSGAVLALVLLAAGVPGWFRLAVEDSWVDNFDSESELIAAEAAFNAAFWGSYRFDVVLSAPRALTFHRSEGLRLMADLTRLAEEGPHVGGVLSHLDIYQKAARVTEGPGPVWELPAERLTRLVRLLSRVQQATDLDQLVLSDGSGARLRVFVRSADYTRARELESYFRRVLPPRLEGTGVEAHFSGDLPLARAVVDAVVGNVLRSVSWTVAGVFLLLWVFLRSVRAAGVTVAPLVCALPILLGGMGFAGVPLGIATSLFTAVTIGVAIDFAIHFTHAYRRHRSSNRAGSRGPSEALEATFASAGRAIRWNAAVLGIGLATLALSGLKPNRTLGLLLAAAMALCYATTVLLLPWLVSALPAPIPPRFPNKRSKKRPGN